MIATLNTPHQQSQANCQCERFAMSVTCEALEAPKTVLELHVGQTVPVRFNGHQYRGVVLKLSPIRVKIRFTTGSGRTRSRWFRQAIYRTEVRS